MDQFEQFHLQRVSDFTGVPVGDISIREIRNLAEEYSDDNWHPSEGLGGAMVRVVGNYLRRPIKRKYIGVHKGEPEYGPRLHDLLVVSEPLTETGPIVQTPLLFYPAYERMFDDHFGRIEIIPPHIHSVMLGALGRVSAEEHDFMIPYYFTTTFEERDVTTTHIDIKQADTAMRYKTANPKGNFMMADASRMPFADGKIDIVIANSLLRSSKKGLHPGIFEEAFRALNQRGGLFMVEALPDKVTSSYNKLRNDDMELHEAYAQAVASHLAELGDMIIAAGFTEVVFYHPDHFKDREAVYGNLYWQSPTSEKEDIEVVETDSNTVPDIIPHNGCVAIYASKFRQGSGEKFLEVSDDSDLIKL